MRVWLSKKCVLSDADARLQDSILFVQWTREGMVRDKVRRVWFHALRLLQHPLLLDLQPAQHRDQHNEHDYSQEAAYNQSQATRQQRLNETRAGQAVLVHHETGLCVQRDHLVALGGDVVLQQCLERILLRVTHTVPGLGRVVVAGGGQRLCGVDGANGRGAVCPCVADSHDTDLVLCAGCQFE